ncbi:protein chibby homolog 1 [Malaclemys terrapin pileata]|uniref:protein chibby homolog 1 n=1 Tax=Malaclemys terrapin pileata TaxID=2991368 RepID=UPI0023A89633|nr:protein chibby homolog 1 [Malaclemys terrapin pileata]
MARSASANSYGPRRCQIRMRKTAGGGLQGQSGAGQGSRGEQAWIWKAMPLFGNTFSPKKTPPRKSASLSNLHPLDRSTREIELGLDYGTPNMNLTGQSLKFENGQWIAESGSSSGDRRETQRLRKRNQQLEEENNLLRLKVDILLDMLSETTAESHLMEKELEDLKSHSRRRK